MKPLRLSRSPWSWIPTLYVAEGLPYFAVNTLTVLMYTTMGIPKGEMAFYTGWLYLPWVIKPIWSPFVDIFGTKRSWVLAMQLGIAVMMGAVALSLPTPLFFSLTLMAFWIMAFFSATHDIAADGYYMLALDKRKQAAYVGVRSTAYRIASVFGQGILVILAGQLAEHGFSPTGAWQGVFLLQTLIFLLLFFWHMGAMPKVESDHAMPSGTRNAGGVMRDIALTFSTFFAKPHIGIALLFMLLYRLPEALCLKLVAPFLVEEKAHGGLGLSVTEVGFANGTVGVVALLAGGIIGGVLIAKGGLRRWLWPMALSLTLPCLLYCYLAAMQPDNFLLICTCIGVEQFGYGFGFTAFMMYLIYFSHGENSTSHYAFCTAFMALGMMLPGMAAGWLWEWLEKYNLLGADGPQGYLNFFCLVMLTTLATFASTEAVRRTLSEEPRTNQEKSIKDNE